MSHHLVIASPEVRLWVYRSIPALNARQQQAIKQKGEEFVRSWQTHGKDLKAEFDIIQDHYLVFFVDQAWARNSGCSIDASVKLIRQLEAEYQLGLFDRMKIGFPKGDTVNFYDFSDLKSLYEAGTITDESPVINHLVDNGAHFESGWQVAFADSPFYAAVR